MGAIYILWLRELKRYVRSRVQIVVSLGQPCLYLLVLGFGLGPVFQKAGLGSYLQFMAPGVIGMTVLFSSVFSGIAMLWDRQFGFLKETLVAPVSRMQIMIGRTLGGATVAVLQGTLILRDLPHRRVPAAQLDGGSRCISLRDPDCGGLRRAGNGDWLDDQGHAGLSTGHEFSRDAAVLPIRRACIRWPILGVVMKVITRLDPLTYGVDGLRGALINQWHFSPAFNASLLGLIALAFLSLGAYLFSKIEV